MGRAGLEPATNGLTDKGPVSIVSIPVRFCARTYFAILRPYDFRMIPVLDCREHKVGEKPCGAAVPVRERVDSHERG